MADNNLRGIGLLVLATAVFSIMDAAMKHLAATYPPIEVTALRALLSLPFILAWVYLRRRGFDTLKAVRWRWHLLRGALGILMLTSFIYAISRMPLSETYTLFFVAPLLITALSVPLLKESVGWRRWAAIGTGFAGVLIVLRPGFADFEWAALAALIGASCYALNAIAVRILGRTDSSAAMSFWAMTFVGIGATCLALPGWEPLRASETGWLILLGVSGALGQLCLTEAFSSAPVSVIAPFEYSALFWGILLDLLIWGKLPDGIVFVGAAVIIASGLYIIYRERRPAVVTPP